MEDRTISESSSLDTLLPWQTIFRVPGPLLLRHGGGIFRHRRFPVRLAAGKVDGSSPAHHLLGAAGGLVCSAGPQRKQKGEGNQKTDSFFHTKTPFHPRLWRIVSDKIPIYILPFSPPLVNRYVGFFCGFPAFPGKNNVPSPSILIRSRQVIPASRASKRRP